MLFDQLLRDPNIEPAIKDVLKQCTLIDASNVSDYYYQGTDQEIWNVANDFPNIAPPFELFFLEFHAPKQIVSKVTGIQPWSADAPKRWGVLCSSQEPREALSDFHSPEGRRALARRAHTHLDMIKKSMGARLLQILQIPNVQEYNAWYAELSDPEQKTIASYISTTHDLELMEANRWEEVEARMQRSLQAMRWELECISFAQFGDRLLRDSNGPHWRWIMNIKPDGLPIVESNGDVNIWHSAHGTPEKMINSVLAQQGHETAIGLLESFRGVFMPHLHTALLAISFMHCKNVTLKQTVTEKPKPLARRQIKRGVEPREPITYHVLDIEPMKQVLSSEGQSERTGIQRALHICRGHFSHYTEEKKLFGKFAGTFWIPQHVKGRQQTGIATKDYRIKEVKIAKP